ncbi:MAG: OmpA family protein, partial [Pseudomonadota bacterium]
CNGGRVMSQVKFVIAGLAATSLTLAGCTEPGEKTAQGAAIGAAVGAGVQILRGADTKDVLGGAVVGGAVGGVIGNQLDKQAEELREQLNGTGARIVNTGSELIVTLPEAITFDIDSAFVRPPIQSALADLAVSINDFPNTIVDVIGHTDNTGTSAYNQNLSKQRADSVAAQLISRGVSSARIRAFGRGKTSPIATNATADGRQANRRVEIIITPTA